MHLGPNALSIAQSLHRGQTVMCALLKMPALSCKGTHSLDLVVSGYTKGTIPFQTYRFTMMAIMSAVPATGACLAAPGCS